ncbi:hypothetical protein [Streptomyces sp. NBC_00102]|uniref:hypothetical protein n=1 Tax=Streptomyces sp. NBC_00102 TaxID=2975652 RepID=UPI0022556EB8|nr:hypothetical protein [Streptomyces sp. NBC_00102]MCX5397639.1 hypothetical protein [Streptomyces sp. NBC_00102]
MMRQQIKLAAVLAVVVLSLTGFSTSSHGHGGSGHSSGGGGGCSSNRSSNGYGSGTGNSSGYDDDDDYDYGSGSDSSSSSSGSTATATDEPTTDTTPVSSTDPTARVVTCARPADGSRKAVTYSEVELTPTSYGTAEVEINVSFLDSADNKISMGRLRVELDASDSLDPQRFKVQMTSPDKVDEVYRCEAEAVNVH